MNLIVICFFIIVLAACGEKRETDSSLKEKFDAIEKFVGNNNWRGIVLQDTIYMYFSRTGDLHFNVYLYQMKNGDSTGTILSEIKTTPDKKVIWTSPDNGEYLLFNAIHNNGVTWKNVQSGKIQAWRKVDSSHLIYSVEGIKALSMEKTLPLATFLVRSHYDYEHGTSYVDSPLVEPRKPVIVK